MVLIWSPENARLNAPGASVDLGAIKLADAQIKAWLAGAKLVIKSPALPESAKRGP